MTALTVPNPLTTDLDALAFKDGKTRFRWPPDGTENYGLVEWSSFSDKAKLDLKGKAGAQKQRVSKTGGDTNKGTFTVRVNLDEPDALNTIAPIIDKLRAGAGPFSLIENPLAQLAGVRGFLVESFEAKPAHETPGELQFVFGYVQVDPDAQSGSGKNVAGTPSKNSALQKAQDEWLARARQAQAYTNNQIQNERAALEARSKETGIALAGRQPKKFQSVFVGEEDIGTTTKAPKKVDPPAGSPAGSAAGSTGL